MLSVLSSRYFLYRDPTDMRKSFDGLCGLISGRLGQNPRSGDVFIFINKQRNRKTITITQAEYQELVSFKTEVEKFKTEVEWLKHQLDQLKRLVFGAKSERFIAPDPAQLSLFDLPAPVQDETKTEEITYTRAKPAKEDKKHPLRAELPAHLPRKVEVIEPENIPEGAEIIGYSITEIFRRQKCSGYVLVDGNLQVKRN